MKRFIVSYNVITKDGVIYPCYYHKKGLFYCKDGNHIKYLLDEEVERIERL